MKKTALLGFALAALALSLPARVSADQVIADDLIVQGSTCVGLDCINNESFGFDTIRLKENNTRIKFEDTSTGAGFPTHDWQLTANDSASGGAEKFSIEDITAATVPFTITGSAPTNSVFVDSTGRLGLRTSTPVLDVHVSTGNTPAMRYEQTSGGGFTAQTWDVAGNEANFFVRDVTGGSRLPFRIRPGAPTSSIDISASGKVGIGTASPATNLDVNVSDSGFPIAIQAKNTNASSTFVGMRLIAGTTTLDFNNAGGQFRINFNDGDPQELSLDAAGNLTITGHLVASGSTFPDYVFAPDYKLLPLPDLAAYIEENHRLPNVPSAAQVAADGMDMTQLQKTMMEKLEELTLYTIRQNSVIEQLQSRITELEAQRAAR